MNCKLVGNVFHSLEVTLNPNDVFYAEKGALIYMDSGIDQNVQMNGSGLRKVLGAKLSGESIFIVKYTNTTNSEKKLVLSGHSGSLQHVKLTVGQTLILRCGDYVASNNKVDLNFNFSINKFFTGMGFAFQKITGDSTVFFDCVDTLIIKDLLPGEEIIVDENHIKALLGIDDSRILIQRNTNVFKNLISGEGWLVTRIIGPGKVFLSSVSSC